MKKIRKALVFVLVLFVFASSSLWSEGMQEQQGKAKNVILLIGDGMGLGAMEIGRLLEYGKDGTLYVQQIRNVGLMTTNSADSIVTDSAAAGTAMATGVRTNNGSIGVDADNREVENITTYFQNKGKKIGLISTNTVYDATPAAFGAHVNSRGAKSEIVRDYYDSGWDVILGGGTKYFGPSKQDGVDMIQKFKDAGYVYVTTDDELAEVSGADKLLGLFNRSYMSYKSDREELNSKEPSLKEMTSKAIEILSKDPDGFFLMSEGARIDHAAHAADATGVWREMIEFDNTVKYCLDWAAEHGDTLVIVTADHQTMGLAPSESINIEALKKIPVSPEYMAGKLKKNSTKTAYTTDSIISVFKEYAGINLSLPEALELQSHLKMNYYSYKVGWEIGSVIAKKMGVGAFDRTLRAAGKTGGHSAAWVPVFAEGPGSAAFRGAYRNTDLFNLMEETTE